MLLLARAAPLHSLAGKFTAGNATVVFFPFDLILPDPDSLLSPSIHTGNPRWPPAIFVRGGVLTKFGAQKTDLPEFC
ncbi:uncharacterized protein DS421_14g474100 [Arachis hypogaea]|nr:uncharacterized protein DS421_14g474100 [Arachis hypogaea]